MTARQKTITFVHQANRNHLVFCHDKIEDITFINIGKVLAEALSKENLHLPSVAYIAEDLLVDILSTPRLDSQIGPYVALENIGILFEPDLGLNLKSTLDNASTNKTIIIRSDGVIVSNRFYFLQDGDGVFIDLTGLSYIEI